MKQIILSSHNNFSHAIKAMQRELDYIWELGLNDVELVFVDSEDNNLWNEVIKYLNQHQDEFSYEIIKQNDTILVTFVL
ncbi:hypothetical protein EG856_02840 [Mycoplasmopsis phocirhinis]|uniref:PTS EIIA type-4 domain-containing protein n=1 Tax=Mycoplasmopsis phocirhinis TaxID=142650 RepID=A0A4P6MQ28_9BACT|nr:hypothetical protein [Mycoplasmopsis phocirhinis]QBF34836.1 hypothetical protein EG856_02840 [Mycoplasmopsis phocirhinis]